MNNLVIGTWNLTSWAVADSNGNAMHPFGEDAVGYSIHTAEQFSIIVMRKNIAKFSSDFFQQWTEQEKAQAFDSVLSMLGDYKIDGDKMYYQIRACSIPNWVGTTQERNIDKLTAQELWISAPEIELNGQKYYPRITFSKA